MTGCGEAGATARGPLDALGKSFYLLQQQDLIVGMDGLQRHLPIKAGLLCGGQGTIGENPGP